MYIFKIIIEATKNWFKGIFRRFKASKNGCKLVLVKSKYGRIKDLSSNLKNIEFN